MGLYVTTKCGHCNETWQLFEYGGNSACGSPNVKCIYCNGVNKTKRNLYRNFNLKDKLSFFISEILFGFIFASIGFVIGFQFFNMFFLEQNFFDYSNSKDAWYWIVIGKLFVAWLSLAPLLFSFKLFYNKFTIFIQIKKMEKAYDKQGGFLWSNQQY
jgi:hypothetical protein